MSATKVCLSLALFQLLGYVVGLSLESPSVPELLVTFEAVPDIGEFRKANPDDCQVPLDARHVQEIAEDGSARQQIVYTVGSRAVGDRLVGLSSDSKSWSSPQDITLQLQYPTAGVGSIVSYVEVVVQQSTGQGRGYIVAGGVGQRYIHLVIESYNTLYFTYTAAIYGF